MSYAKEGYYAVAEGDDGEIYIFIKAKKNDPSHPQLIYDGHDHALFVRNEQQNIVLDYINPDVREKIRHVPEVIMVETLLDNVKESYPVEVKMVEKIPVDWSEIGLTTWEKASLDLK